MDTSLVRYRQNTDVPGQIVCSNRPFARKYTAQASKGGVIIKSELLWSVQGAVTCLSHNYTWAPPFISKGGESTRPPPPMSWPMGFSYPNDPHEESLLVWPLPSDLFTKGSPTGSTKLHWSSNEVEKSFELNVIRSLCIVTARIRFFCRAAELKSLTIQESPKVQPSLLQNEVIQAPYKELAWLGELFKACPTGKTLKPWEKLYLTGSVEEPGDSPGGSREDMPDVTVSACCHDNPQQVIATGKWMDSKH